jgi:SsrA-binding protein
LNPQWSYPHQNLNLARLPISPPPHGGKGAEDRAWRLRVQLFGRSFPRAWQKFVMSKGGAGAKKNDAPTIGNPKARWRYEILETLECGIMLAGPEVKSLRQGHGSIEEAYARFKGGELWIVGMRIEEYRQSGYAKHEPSRPRKLLARRAELAQLRTDVERRGLTLVPLKLYWSDRGFVKIEVALVKGRKVHDKRAVDKEKSAKREMSRAMKRR